MYWLTAGKTLGGLALYKKQTCLTRETALELYTRGSAWFSGEQDNKGMIRAGMLADLTVLDKDYFQIADEEIKNIESELTIVGGKIVYAKGSFSSFSPEPIPILPDWSPANIYNGYYNDSNHLKPITHAQNQLLLQVHQCAGSCNIHSHDHNAARLSKLPVNNYTAFWGAMGCSCFAF